jgi:hypothetical protein
VRAHLLGRHVKRRADRGLRPREPPPIRPIRIQDLGHAEIGDLEQLGAVGVGHEVEIGWLDVAVDDAHGVRRRQPLRDL